MISEILWDCVVSKKKTDGAKVHILVESINLAAKQPVHLKDRQRIDRLHMLEPWDRVAIYGHSGSTFLLAYLVKYNFGGAHFRLLGGERITINGPVLYFPIKSGLKLFDNFERNKEIQDKVYKQAQDMVGEDVAKSKHIKVGQLISKLTTLGYSLLHVEQVVAEYCVENI